MDHTEELAREIAALSAHIETVSPKSTSSQRTLRLGNDNSSLPPI